MPWEEADTVWTVICVIIVALMALAVRVLHIVQDQRRLCVCEDSDNCTCGGAWGRRVP